MARLSKGRLGSFSSSMWFCHGRGLSLFVGRRWGLMPCKAPRRWKAQWLRWRLFPLEQSLGKGLQILVYAEGDIFAGLCLFVVFAILVMALCAAVYVAQHDSHAFFATQLRFVCTLHTEFAYVVARGVVFGRVFSSSRSLISPTSPSRWAPMLLVYCRVVRFSTLKPLKRNSFSRKSENS